jgi:hypothetical protein
VTNEHLVVSTASKILTKVEKKNPTCEKELLPVVYVLQKFRIYVSGQAITLYTDNKALTFIKMWNLASGRVTRWIMQLQEYGLSRKLVGRTQENQYMSKGQKEILVAKIDLGIDETLKKKLNNLSQCQRTDS